MIATRRVGLNRGHTNIGADLIMYGANILYIIQKCQNEQWHQNITKIILCHQHECMELHKVWEEELIAKAWHPDRFVDWCLDIEEQKEWNLED
jgi:hypothetical protein